LSGTVVARSAAVGALVEDAVVSIPRLTKSTSTDSAGRFRLSGVSCGRHEVQVRKIGFTVLRDTVDLVGGQDATRIYTLLAITQLDTVRTNADEIQYQTPRLRDFEARRKTRVSGSFIGEATLRQVENHTMATILRRVPGLGLVSYNGQTYVRSLGAGMKDQPLSIVPGAPRGCWSPVYLDGLLIFDGKVDAYTKPPDMGQFFPLNLSGVEYYARAGTAPLQFRNTISNCGILLLWTRGR
jgi:hypothetical protein